MLSNSYPNFSISSRSFAGNQVAKFVIVIVGIVAVAGHVLALALVEFCSQSTLSSWTESLFHDRQEIVLKVLETTDEGLIIIGIPEHAINQPGVVSALVSFENRRMLLFREANTTIAVE